MFNNVVSALFPRKQQIGVVPCAERFDGRRRRAVRATCGFPRWLARMLIGGSYATSRVILARICIRATFGDGGGDGNYVLVFLKRPEDLASRSIPHAQTDSADTLSAPVGGSSRNTIGAAEFLHLH